MTAIEERIGDWFCTRSGKRFYVMDPRPEDFDIESICWSLSNECRFGGHSEFYTVLQHSCLVSDQLPQHLKLAGIAHDFPEAYIKDLPKPVKNMMPVYREIEQNIWLVMAGIWGLPEHLPFEVKIADCRMLLTERNQLMPDCENTRYWMMDDSYKPYDIKIDPWIPARARAEFLKRWAALTT